MRIWTLGRTAGLGIGVLLLFAMQVTAQATQGHSSGDAAAPPGPSVAGGPDTDGDGCPDAQEQQTAVGSEFAGGRRDYLNPYDYFEPTHDGMNRADDMLMVVQAYFQDGDNPDTDRTLVGPLAWNLGPPNGLQRIDDIIYQIQQFGHDCS